MGVEGGSSCFISYEPKHVVLKNNTFKYVVIDAYSLICRYVIGAFNSKTYIVDKTGKKIAEIYFLFIIALRFLDNGIVPIFVFDGSAPHIKSETVEKRRAAKEKAGEILKEFFGDNDTGVKPTNTTPGQEGITEQDLDGKLDSKLDGKRESTSTEEESYEDLDTYIKYLKRSFRLSMPNIEFAKLLLRWMGLPVVDAPGEADPQCAAIATEYAHSVIGVITDDFDPLMYKSVNILKLPNLGSSFVNEYSRDQTLEHMRKKVLGIIRSSSDPQIKDLYGSINPQTFEFTHDNLIEIGCLMGTDFCPGLKVKRTCDRNRFETILELYIRNKMSMDLVLNSMRSTLSKTYISRMMSARDAYKSAEIFDPKKMDISFKKPCIPMIKKLCADVISAEDLDGALQLIESAYTNYEMLTVGKLCSQSMDKFTSFTSYRARYAREKSMLHDRYSGNATYCGTGGRFAHRKQFPEPRHRIPITMEA